MTFYFPSETLSRRAAELDGIFKRGKRVQASTPRSREARNTRDAAAGMQATPTKATPIGSISGVGFSFFLNGRSPSHSRMSKRTLGSKRKVTSSRQFSGIVLGRGWSEDDPNRPRTSPTSYSSQWKDEAGTNG